MEVEAILTRAEPCRAGLKRPERAEACSQGREPRGWRPGLYADAPSGLCAGYPAVIATLLDDHRHPTRQSSPPCPAVLTTNPAVTATLPASDSRATRQSAP